MPNGLVPAYLWNLPDLLCESLKDTLLDPKSRTRKMSLCMFTRKSIRPIPEEHMGQYVMPPLENSKASKSRNVLFRNSF